MIVVFYYLLLVSSGDVSVVVASSSSSAAASSAASAAGGGGGGMIVRIRMSNGSMERVQIPPGSENTMTLHEILQSLPQQQQQQQGGGKEQGVASNSIIQVGSVVVTQDDATRSTLAQLGLQHGSLVTLSTTTTTTNGSKNTNNNDEDDQASTTTTTTSRFASLKQQHLKHRWDPYPDLAKNYEQALLKTKTRRSSQKGMSYGDIAHLQSSLHIVEPQPDGPLLRVYMCRYSAERFQINGRTTILPNSSKNNNNNNNQDPIPRVGLLLGTIQRERVDKHKPRPGRTSLSSQVSDSEYCMVAKVQAIWEPPRQEPHTSTATKSSGGSSSSSTVYDLTVSQTLLDRNPRVLEIADLLGLVPVGWIFSYSGNNRHQGDDALPIMGIDVQTGAMLQIANMKKHDAGSAVGGGDRIEGAKFVTLAMDGSTGATEAFQLSCVSVQMVSEGMFVGTGGGDSTTTVPNDRYIPMKRPALVDGKETTLLDSVLCLVNTAMLSHEGTFAGSSAVSTIKKKNGTLTNKAKKALRDAITMGNNDNGDDARLLQELCNLNTLLALDQTLNKDDSTELCQLVRKWARGQKKGTRLSPTLKLHLQSILES
jgi:hypothetical protein